MQMKWSSSCEPDRAARGAGKEGVKGAGPAQQVPAMRDNENNNNNTITHTAATQFPVCALDRRLHNFNMAAIS